MHSGRRNKYVAVVLTLVMLLSIQLPVYAKTEAVPVKAESRRLAIELTSAQKEALIRAEQADGAKASFKESSIYNHKWDKYSSNYFYNHATDKQKEVWDLLDEKSRAFLDGADNYLTDADTHYLTFLLCEGGDDISYEDLYAAVSAFKYSNPQYYFLSNVYYSLPDDRSYGGAGLGIYNRFIDSDERKQATNAFKLSVDSVEALAGAAKTDEDKIKIIHDAICTRVTYISNFDVSNEQETFSQSAYSALCTDKAVCAGYTLAFEAVCNSLGINCMGITSSNHAWNKVEINDSWVNVDLTWDDAPSIKYGYFKMSDKKMAELSDEFSREEESAAHTMEAGWMGKVPVCTIDSGSTASEPKNLPAPVGTTAEPVMTYKKTNKGYKIALTCKTNGASVYYTIDGTSPEPSASKCTRYEGEFYVDDYKKVKAVAICDKRFDSNHVITYNIVFKGNGAASGKVQPIKNAKYGASYKLRANKFVRAGYKFAGWSLSKKGDNILKAGAKVKNLTMTNGKNIVYYARWTKK